MQPPPPPDPGPDIRISRRALLRASACLGVTWVLAACSRSGEPGETAADGEARDQDLDEPKSSFAHRPRLPDTQPVVRVRLRRIREAERRVRIGSEGQWISAGPVDEPAEGRAVKGPLTIEVSSGRWTVVDGADARSSFDSASPLDLVSIDPREPTLKVSGRPHPEVVRLVDRPGTPHRALEVVNHVSLEAYLPGVVAAELFESWKLPTYQAQAVAARSFACAEHAYFSSRRHYDLTNTTRSQVYVGSVAQRRAIDAVALTRGEVLAYQGYLVPGYYSSCCGGTSARAVDAIGTNPINAIEPLNGRGQEEACRTAPVFSWQVEHSVDSVTRRLVAFGRRARRQDLVAIGRVRAIEVAAANQHGRPTQFTVAGDDGASALVSADDLRRAVNGDGMNVPVGKSRLKSSHVKANIDGEVVTFEGHGFGHGVGLCQYGAESLAREGKAYEAIIEWYYPGAEVVRAYS